LFHPEIFDSSQKKLINILRTVTEKVREIVDQKGFFDVGSKGEQMDNWLLEEMEAVRERYYEKKRGKPMKRRDLMKHYQY
jgi:hypothetical protein